MPEKPNRSERIILRVSPAEKALVAESAKAVGLKVSEYIRREAGIGRFGRADLRRKGPVERELAAWKATRTERGETSEARVKELTRTMPETSARKLAARESAAAKAKAAREAVGS